MNTNLKRITTLMRVHEEYRKFSKDIAIERLKNGTDKELQTSTRISLAIPRLATQFPEVKRLLLTSPMPPMREKKVRGFR